MSDSDIVKRLLEMSATKNIKTGSDLMELSMSLAPDPEEDIELGRLDWSPRKNWVENEGGLPKYIEDVAIGIMKGSGKTREQAIAIAISRIKRWAAGLDGVKKDTQAKAVAALAQWEKMKASARAKRLAKKK